MLPPSRFAYFRPRSTRTAERRATLEERVAIALADGDAERVSQLLQALAELCEEDG
jgi:hypothetical protein